MNQAIAANFYEEGKKLHSQKKYAEAIVKFQAAQFHCSSNKTEDLNKYKNKEAISLNEQGHKLRNNEDYTGAAEKYSAAYETCTNDYRHKQAFKNNINCAKAADLNEQGNSLNNQHLFAEAIAKYQAAYSICPSNKTEYLNRYKNNEANSLNNQGTTLWNNKDYIGAAEKYSEAYETCTNDYRHKQTFKNNIKRVKAAGLTEALCNLNTQHLHAQAIAKYQAAQSHCPSNKTEDLNKYKNNEAVSLNEQGHKLWNNKDYTGAAEKYSAANETCTNDYSDKQTFKNHINGAEAGGLNEEGNQLYTQNLYAEAITKYQAAHNQCPSKRTIELNIYTNNEASSLIEQGLELLNNQDYAGAVDKFNGNYQTCTIGYSGEQSNKENIYLAKADASNVDGDKSYNNKKYAEAITQYQTAHIDYLDKCKNTEAHSLNMQGLELCNSKNNTGAAAQFNEVYQKFTSGYSNKYTLEDNMNFAKAEALNAEGNMFYNIKKYEDAITRYQAAHSQCPSNKFDDLDRYKNNEANSLNMQGLELRNNKNYAGAAAKFTEAYQKCTSGNSDEQIFKDNMFFAKAEALNTDGDNLFNEKQYAEAIAKYQDAHKYCPSNEFGDLNKYKNNEASSLNHQGHQLYNNKDYTGAAEKYSAAYETCTNGYSGKQIFKDNINIAKTTGLNAEGGQLYNQKQYAEAIVKYQAAQNQCPSFRTVELNIFRNNEAISLNQQGHELYINNDYIGAADKYSAAYEICTNDCKDKQIFKDNINIAKAGCLNAEGDQLYNQKQYAEAIGKYQAAQYQCPLDKTACLNVYKNNEAGSLSQQGNALFNNKEYICAADKYSAAYEICANDCSDKQTFKDNMNFAKAEASNAEGDNLFNKRKYEEAIVQYQIAHSQCPLDKTEDLNKYKNNEANSFNDQGLELLYNGDYAGAFAMLNNAFQKCSNGYNEKAIIESNRDKAKHEVDALNLYQCGERFFNELNYSDALKEYQAAHSISKENSIYKSAIIKAQAEINAVRLNNEGNFLFESGDYSGAKYKYQLAYDISEVAKNEYKSNKVKAETEIYAIELSIQARNLFYHGKFFEAIIKYREAYDNSQQSTQRKKYQKYIQNIQQTKVNNAEDFTLLNEKAIAEEDPNVQIKKNEKAQQKFEKAISFCPSSDIYSSNLTKLNLNQNEALVLLKAEGSEILNSDIESQQKLMSLLQEAKELKQQQQHKLFYMKYQEARDLFFAANEKFRKENICKINDFLSGN